MNIEQMLRDAIERKTAKILKEEYGIEMSKKIADKLPKDDQDCTAHVEKIVCDDDPLDWTVIPPDEQNDQDDQDEQPVYQVTLLEAGPNREELIKKAYQDSEKSGREYERVVRYVESILADEQKEQKNEKVRNRIRGDRL